MRPIVTAVPVVCVPVGPRENGLTDRDVVWVVADSCGLQEPRILVEGSDSPR